MGLARADHTCNCDNQARIELQALPSLVLLAVHQEEDAAGRAIACLEAGRSLETASAYYGGYRMAHTQATADDFVVEDLVNARRRLLVGHSLHTATEWISLTVWTAVAEDVDSCLEEVGRTPAFLRFEEAQETMLAGSQEAVQKSTPAAACYDRNQCVTLLASSHIVFDQDAQKQLPLLAQSQQ